MTLIAQPQQVEALAAQRDKHAALGGQLQRWPVHLQMPVNSGLMKADLRRAPTLLPELRLHALGFLGRVRMQLIFRSPGFVRDLVLLGEPRA
jgi:hypothetical protein